LDSMRSFPNGAHLFEVSVQSGASAQCEHPPQLTRRMSLRTRGVKAEVSSGRELMLHTTLVAIQLVLAVSALITPIFKRVVGGAIGIALRDRGIDFDASFSLSQLAWLAGQAGGPDYFMAATCFTFLVVGPLARPLTQLWLMWVPMKLHSQRILHRVSRHISIFYAFEVMLLAVPLLQLAFGPLTNHFVNPDSVSFCRELVTIYHTGDQCFEINVTPAWGYYVTAIAYVGYLISGVDGSLTHKYLHRSLYPDPETPPNLSC